MKVTVLLFARLREIAGTEKVEIEVPQGCSPRRIASLLASQHPAIQPHLKVVSYAIDGEFVDPDMVLEEVRELALIPPVSGG